jgi:4-hydroxy-3-methylbut-2-enyl diphosphate reductase IspH
VQTAADLQPEWFFGAENVGITAGTSTPDGVIDSVEHALRLMAEQRPVRASVGVAGFPG